VDDRPRSLGYVTAVVPVKPLFRAKSRLAVDDDERADLALAFAVDTVSALTASRHVADVLVVTPDPCVAERLEALGARVVRDDGSGLDEALHHGLGAASRLGLGVAVVPGDLPCLRPADVDVVLAQVPRSRGMFVPDLEGSGTTVVVHPPGLPAVTRYGPGSAVRHRSLGLLALDAAPLRARQDVDTLDDLRAAAELGLGHETRRVLAARDIDLVPSLL
jgi:2-phospho-L-lactate guanylyltransferase